MKHNSKIQHIREYESAFQVASELQILAEGLKVGFALDSPLDALLNAQIDIALLITELIGEGFTLRSIQDEWYEKVRPEPLFREKAVVKKHPPILGPKEAWERNTSHEYSVEYIKKRINNPSPLIYPVESDNLCVGSMRDSSIHKVTRRRKILSEIFSDFEDKVIEYSVQYLTNPTEIGKEFVHPSQSEQERKSIKLTKPEYWYWKRARSKRSHKSQ